MALISLKDVTLGFGGLPLLDGVNLQLQDGDRLCLLGRNGTGKSSLLRMIAGHHTPDGGQLAIGRDVRVSYLEQESRAEFGGTALEYCLDAAATQVQAEKHLTRLGMNAHDQFDTLSGGGQRRVMLAAVLAHDADILLLDEPTNHLDIQAVVWLEDFLTRQVRTLMLVTHDRAFARAVSNRIAELDRGELFSFDCGFDEFLKRRDEQLAAEERKRALADKELAREEAWLRRGVRARRTRDEGRVHALLKMREEYKERRLRLGQVNLRVQDAGRSGNLVAEATELVFGYPPDDKNSPPARPIIPGLTTTIMRGDKVGIVGPNGVGKTTLIRLLLGELKPQSGSVRIGKNIKPLYFDQIRNTLDQDKTVVENLVGTDPMVIIGGKQKHINAYLGDFLFEPDRARSKVSILSGGEKNRLLLAKLFLQPSNLLVMDEPTNDLDMETLGLLEEMLLTYPGTLLLVSHDRELLDNVVSDCLVFTPDGAIRELAGGYSDWEHYLTGTETRTQASPPSGQPQTERRQARTKARKLTFKETRELTELPEQITDLELSISKLHETMADAEIYRSQPERIAGLTADLAVQESRLAEAYKRWEELEEIERKAAEA